MRTSYLMISLLLATPWSQAEPDLSLYIDGDNYIGLSYFENTDTGGDSGMGLDVRWKQEFNFPQAYKASEENPSEGDGTKTASRKNTVCVDPNDSEKEVSCSGAAGKRYKKIGLDLNVEGKFPFRESVGHRFGKVGVDWDYMKILAQPAGGGWGYGVSAGVDLSYEFGGEDDNRQASYEAFLKAKFTYPLSATLPPNYPASSFNPLEWPFIALRAVAGAVDTNVDDSFVAAGLNSQPDTPLFHFRYGLVDPDKDEARKAILGGDENYDRWSAEVSHTSPLFLYDGAEYGIAVTFRHYREVGASTAIEDAGLDRFTYRAIALQRRLKDSKILLSYSSGKLPFDLQDESVVSLGWSYNLK